MPIHKRNGSRGDLYMEFAVDFPKTLNAKARQGIKKWLPGGPKTEEVKSKEEDLEAVRLEEVDIEHEKAKWEQQRQETMEENDDDDDDGQHEPGESCRTQKENEKKKKTTTTHPKTNNQKPVKRKKGKGKKIIICPQKTYLYSFTQI